MRRLAAAILLLTPLALAAQQQPAQQPTQQEQDAGTVPTIRTSTQIVLVDVTVQDKQGNPIHGLSKDSFVLTEDKHPQTIRHFEEHTPDSSKPGLALPPMPAGTFTNYTPTPENGALNILLVDSLNTPLTDQSYVRAQLAEFVKKAKPGQRIAIFGLSQRLFMLQGFSSDPQVLRNSVEHKLIQRQSTLLDSPVDSADALTDGITDQSMLSSSSLSQFQAETSAMQTQLRVQYTLDAFNTLAHYLQAFPGRKNLIWFSGSFPINILPDATLDNPFAVMNVNEDEFRDTTNLLARAQVAVYPVDARGLMTNPAFSASQRGGNLGANPAGISNKIARFEQSQADEHMTMDQLADETGGHAFYNNNDLAGAVSSAINSGSNFYALTYSPQNKKWDESYRTIKVTLAPTLAKAGYKLAYRQGYYAFDPSAPTSKKKKADEALPSVVTTDAQVASQSTGAAFARAAMAHGAPTPQDILFKVRVLPASTKDEPTPAYGNQLDPLHPARGPFRTMLVDYAIPGSYFDLTKSPEGRYVGAIEFSTLLYDRDGRLLNATGRAIKLNLTPENYAIFRKVVRVRLEVSVPVKSGESFLRIGVHDLSNNRFGVVEIPVASVAKLPPPPDAPAPAATPAATPPTTQPNAKP
ncbi:MAG: VWA domain-containing protein [Acidobacteriaceae bacterium]|nr:VWA domain-containing protein [Acidobacteriaceae bacterium]